MKRFLYDGVRAPARLDAGERDRRAVEPDPRRRSATRRCSARLSGGVDSAVAALLVHRAVGEQLTCVFVDHGLYREGEPEQVEETFARHFRVPLVHVKAADRFLAKLAGVTDPEAKRKAIGEEFIRVFEEVAREHAGARFLVQGTLYPDVIESGSRDGGQRSRAITTSAGCPRTWTSSSSSRCATSSRTRSARWGRARPAGGDRAAAAVPRPGPRRADRRGGDAPRTSRSCAAPTTSSARRSAGPGSSARPGRRSACSSPTSERRRDGGRADLRAPGRSCAP